LEMHLASGLKRRSNKNKGSNERFSWGVSFHRQEIWNRENILSFQLLTWHFEWSVKFGVPKHSDFEPDYFVAERNRKPP